MGVPRRSEANYDTSLRVIAERLRDEGESDTRVPLPRRWVELIHSLDERERRNSEHPRTAADEPVG
jgi:hypothetical protein